MKAKLFSSCVLTSFALLVVSGFTDILSVWVHPGSQSSSSSGPLHSPPAAPVRPVIDDYYGTKVVDPYRYMENLRDPEVQSWIKAQNDYTRSVEAHIPGRQGLLARIRELDQSVPQVWAQRLPGNDYLIGKFLPGHSTWKLYLRKGLNGEDRLLLDPERVTVVEGSRGKGKNVIADVSPSNDGRYIAVTIVPGGSEIDTELHVIETASARDTGDVIPRCCIEDGVPSWLPDSYSFVYGRMQKLRLNAPVTEVREKIRSYLHVLGSDPEKDQAVFGYGVVPSINVDASLVARVSTQPESKYVLGVLSGGAAPNNAYYIARVNSIGKSDVEWHKVADFSDEVSRVGRHGDDLYLLTYKDAPRYKIIRTDARRPDLASAATILPPSKAVITSIATALDALYVRLEDGGVSQLLRVTYGPNPKLERVDLPFEGAASEVTDPRLPGAMLYMTSWTEALRLYSYDPQTKQVIDTRLQPVGQFDNPVKVKSIEVKVSSYDGTLVPLSIVYPEGMKLDGSNPTLIEGYGAYGISQDPFFSSTGFAWYERGGVYAFCHVRGGGEYGEEWHLAGKGATKPNTWRDFIACAEYLINKKYTSPARLAGQGESAGGILIGRAITEQPDLFAAAIIDVGVLDTVRLETTASGEANIPEFGSVKTQEGFKALYAMSSYDHVGDRTSYPAVLLTTGINDARLDPWEPAKMAARLQASTTSGKPVLLRVDYGGGHGGGSGLEESQERLADSWSFLLWQFGVPEFQPKER